MILIRSSKSHFNKFLTAKKKNELNLVMKEYSYVVNAYIGRFQKMIPRVDKYELTLAKNLHVVNSWLSARMKKNAMWEAYGLVQSAKSNARNRKQNYVRPVHRGNQMILSQTVATINTDPSIKDFDLIVILGCIGKSMKLNIPLKKHDHFNKYSSWKMSKSITIYHNCIQFSWEKNISKKSFGKAVAIDFGINKFIATSNGQTFGEGYKKILLKLSRKKQKSKAWHKCKEELKEFTDLAIKNFPFDNYGLIVVENLNNVHHKMKLKRRLSKNMRRIVSNWNFRYIYEKLFRECNNNCVSYSQVSSYNNSITCPSCNHVDKNNRQSQELFRCSKCGFSDNADYTSADVALRRKFLGIYGSEFKMFKPQYLIHNVGNECDGWLGGII